jgi:hypothetical protein
MCGGTTDSAACRRPSPRASAVVAPWLISS